MEPYPQMKPEAAALPTASHEPLWQVLQAKVPPLAGARVLALHCHDGAFCRAAINAGAIAVLGVDHDGTAISHARDLASSDRLRFRIMPDRRYDLLTGPYDLIVGPFSLPTDDLRRSSHLLAKLLRPNGQMLLAVSGGQSDGQVRSKLSSWLTVTECFRPKQSELAGSLIIIAQRAKAAGNPKARRQH